MINLRRLVLIILKLCPKLVQYYKQAILPVRLSSLLYRSAHDTWPKKWQNNDVLHPENTKTQMKIRLQLYKNSKTSVYGSSQNFVCLFVAVAKAFRGLPDYYFRHVSPRANRFLN